MNTIISVNKYSLKKQQSQLLIYLKYQIKVTSAIIMRVIWDKQNHDTVSMLNKIVK